jgi:hypothetical protein
MLGVELMRGGKPFGVLLGQCSGIAAVIEESELGKIIFGGRKVCAHCIDYNDPSDPDQITVRVESM